MTIPGNGCTTCRKDPAFRQHQDRFYFGKKGEILKYFAKTQGFWEIGMENCPEIGNPDIFYFCVNDCP